MRTHIVGEHGRYYMTPELIALCEAQNWRCAYCAIAFELRPAPTTMRFHAKRLIDGARPSFDEVIPRSLGGDRSWENQVAACRSCNSSKGSEDAVDFAARVAERLILADDLGLPIIERRPPPAEFVPMTERRRDYFIQIYGFAPEETTPATGETA